MDALTTQKEINEVTRLRQQASWWRWGASLLVLTWILGCFLSVNSSVQGLFQPGARQEKFVSTLSSNVQRDVVPGVQTIAAQTLSDTRPAVEAAFTKINGRVPEVTETAMNELQGMQESLPQKSEKILGDSFGAMLAQKETKLHEMFPDATDESIKELTKNLTDVAQIEAVNVNDKMIGRHQKSLDSIVASMEHIRMDESKKAGSPLGSNWEMAISIMDVVRDDLKDMEALAAKQNKEAEKKTAASAAMPVAKNTAKETR